ncbi:MAG: serine/threonine protein kinase [Clostridiales bacterium]|jgi:serine/threonine protein kinase|nr:serine/threonine protein kinase [Clostridiales bacterium]
MHQTNEANTITDNARTHKTICLVCFGDLDKDRVCVQCKEKSDDTPSPAHHIPARSVLNKKYLLGKSIGEGGFGITYFAWNLNTGNRVAIKEYYPSGNVNRMPRSNSIEVNDKANQVSTNRSLQRFKHEAKTLVSLKNTDGIVSVQDFFSANNTAYIVMEYLDGISLKTYHKTHGNIGMSKLCELILPVIDGLQHVHQQGIIHRDISPDNIIITKQNTVKLIDFGAAKRINNEGEMLSVVLKHGFAPEEQYRSQGIQGPWSDIYALAASMYYCITGKLPPESVQRLHKDLIVKPSLQGCDINPLQEVALMRALSVFAKNRYQNMSQFKEALFKSNKKSKDKIPSTTSINEEDTKISAHHKSKSNFLISKLLRKRKK